MLYDIHFLGVNNNNVIFTYIIVFLLLFCVHTNDIVVLEGEPSTFYELLRTIYD